MDVEAAVGQLGRVEQILANEERRAHVAHHLVRARAGSARPVGGGCAASMQEGLRVVRRGAQARVKGKATRGHQRLLT